MSTATATTPEASTRITWEVVDVDPELAMEWLLNNENNRKHREALVRQYAQDMVEGRWEFNGEPIQFSATGRLLNGQHRLKAVLRSQTTQKFTVGRGFADSIQGTIDTGARRTAGDSLTLEGFTNTRTLAALAKLVIAETECPRNYLRFAELRPTSTHVREVVYRDPTLAEATNFTIAQLPTQLAPASSLAYTWWKLAAINRDLAGDFFQGLTSLEDLSSGSPIIALHRRLVAHRLSYAGSRGSKNRATEVAAYVFGAWNAWRKGEERVLLKAVRGDDGFLRFPRPIA